MKGNNLLEKVDIFLKEIALSEITGTPREDDDLIIIPIFTETEHPFNGLFSFYDTCFLPLVRKLALEKYIKLAPLQRQLEPVDQECSFELIIDLETIYKEVFDTVFHTYTKEQIKKVWEGLRVLGYIDVEFRRRYCNHIV